MPLLSHPTWTGQGCCWPCGSTSSSIPGTGNSTQPLSEEQEIIPRDTKLLNMAFSCFTTMQLIVAIKDSNPVPKKRTNIGTAQEVQGLTRTLDLREGKKYFYIFVTSSNSTNNHADTLDLVKRHYYFMWQQRHVQHASTMPQGKACMTKRIL